MHWQLSYRTDPVTRQLADRHYNRQSIGAANFVPPGRCLVLRSITDDAFWVTSWPFAEYVKHDWAGAWVCSAFRNESPVLSSELIRQAVAVTLWYRLSGLNPTWNAPLPALGMITFVNTDKVRKKRDWGRCYRKAGFKHVGYTGEGLVALQLLPDAMPEPMEPVGAQLELFAA